MYTYSKGPSRCTKYTPVHSRCSDVLFVQDVITRAQQAHRSMQTVHILHQTHLCLCWTIVAQKQTRPHPRKQVPTYKTQLSAIYIILATCNSTCDIQNKHNFRSEDSWPTSHHSQSADNRVNVGEGCNAMYQNAQLTGHTKHSNLVRNSSGLINQYVPPHWQLDQLTIWINDHNVSACNPEWKTLSCSNYLPLVICWIPMPVNTHMHDHQRVCHYNQQRKST